MTAFEKQALLYLVSSAHNGVSAEYVEKMTNQVVRWLTPAFRLGRSSQVPPNNRRALAHRHHLATGDGLKPFFVLLFAAIWPQPEGWGYASTNTCFCLANS